MEGLWLGPGSKAWIGRKAPEGPTQIFNFRVPDVALGEGVSSTAVPKLESTPWLSTDGLGDPRETPALSGLMSLSGLGGAWQGPLSEAR